MFSIYIQQDNYSLLEDRATQAKLEIHKIFI